MARWAEEQGLPWYAPEDRKALGQLAEERPEILVAAAYGRILPKALLDAATHRLNVHPSLLPRWRGAAPITWALLEGDAVTGVTLLDITPEVDAGVLYAQKPLPVAPDEDAGHLTARLSELAATMVGEALDSWRERGTWNREWAQVGAEQYARRLYRADELLCWSDPATALARRIRALSPAPLAYTRTPLGAVKIARAHVGSETGQAALPGTVLVANARDGLQVACGNGHLFLDQVRPASGRTMSGAAFAAGRPGLVGMVWGDGTVHKDG